MMGTKIRGFEPLPRDVSLEDLVPQDSFYRRLEGRLDLSFVRELVAPLYAKGGRPSVDPEVFFKLQLVMFFENVRGERQLMRVVADRISVRWCLGYDLHEPLPEHSSLTIRIRDRYGLEVFGRFFERIVETCAEAGHSWRPWKAFLNKLLRLAGIFARERRVLVRHAPVLSNRYQKLTEALPGCLRNVTPLL